MKNNKLLGAILLISGTAIGAGMLALPVITAEYGFIPSFILFIITWLFMTFAALCMLEVNLWLPVSTNMISMSKATLGKTGQIIAWSTYLLLLYSLMAAYLSGLDAMLQNTLKIWLNIHLDLIVGASILIIIFGFVIYLGDKTIDYINRIFMLGLIVTFVCFIILIAPHIQFNYLTTIKFNGVWFALPIITTSFGFQIIIPSLRPYLNSDVKQLRKAILIGSLITLIVYLFWELLVMGVIPTYGSNGLLHILNSGQPAVGLTIALQALLHHSWIAQIEEFFAFFAIITAFIGVAFSLFDFLADGLRIKKNHIGRISTALLTFIPPLIFTLAYPRGFIIALGFAGIFVAILLCMMPAAMVISGRYWKKMATGYRVKGGIFLLALLVLFSILVIVFEIMTK